MSRQTAGLRWERLLHKDCGARRVDFQEKRRRCNSRMKENQELLLAAPLQEHSLGEVSFTVGGGANQFSRGKVVRKRG